MYDPWVGRWWGVDPLADMYSPWTPYCYGLNSPISTIDPDGMSSEKVNDEECETCPIVRGDYIPGTTTQASTDEVVITAKKKEEEPTTMAASTDEFLIFRAFEQIEADYMAQARLDYQMTHMATGGLTHVDPFFDILSGGGAAKASIGMTLGAYLVKKGAERSIRNTVTRSQAVLGHIFRNSEGHVNPTTAASVNRYINLFEDIGNNPALLNSNVLQGIQKTIPGIQGYAKTFRNGKQVWVQVNNGKIFNAGVNTNPK